MHLRRSAFEEAAAAPGKERVAAEEDRCLAVGRQVEVGDVAGGMAGHVDHLEAKAEQLDRIAIMNGGVGLGDLFTRRAEDRALEARAQCRKTADVIAVVVGH